MKFLVDRLARRRPDPVVARPRVSEPPLPAAAVDPVVPERGGLDFASRKLIAGWAWPRDGECHALVDIRLDEVPFATLVADRQRPDLAGTGRTDLGFILPVDLPRDERQIAVIARVRGAPADLAEAPRLIPPVSAVQGVDNPDWYRDTTARFLAWRFDAGAYFDGVYNGHQPIYGFGVQPCEPGWLERYTITHAIMTELAGLDFTTLADIGGAEGYKGAMIRELFGAEVLNADLSPEACRLAERIYGLQTRAVSMEALPFADESFDCVLCSESLEHVSQPGRSLAELLRIARKAVVITVPAETLEQVSSSIQSGDPHAHVNWFDLAAFDHLASALHQVRTRPILTLDPRWRAAGSGVEAMVRLFKGDERVRADARAMIAALVLRDQSLIGRGAGFNGLIAVLQKRPCARDKAPVSLERIMDFTVPPVGRA